jgi:hypothetical protein
VSACWQTKVTTRCRPLGVKESSACWLAPSHDLSTLSPASYRYLSKNQQRQLAPARVDALRVAQQAEVAFRASDEPTCSLIVQRSVRAGRWAVGRVDVDEIVLRLVPEASEVSSKPGKRYGSQRIRPRSPHKYDRRTGP